MSSCFGICFGFLSISSPSFLDKNLYFPKNKQIFVYEGSSIDLVDSSLIYSKSPISMLGTRDNPIKFFSSEYYNTPQNFDGSFTATFPFNSDLIKKILKKKKCIVEFFERDTGFYFPVYISKLKKTDIKWLYTFWHNSFFNNELNNNIDILYFNPEKTGLIKKSKS